jgi:hypothetical protein
MDSLRLGRQTLGYVVSLALLIGLAAILAGCGGAGTTASVPPALTQSAAHHATSSSGDLLYVTTDGLGTLQVLSYPALQVVETLSSVGFSAGASNLSNGDVCLSNNIIESYHHGAKSPFETLKPPGTLTDETSFTDCAFDPTTGNAAGSLWNEEECCEPVVAVYKSPSNPVLYSDPNMAWASFLAYDNTGNLFFDGVGVNYQYMLDELPKGSSKPIELAINKQIGPMLSLAWDGEYITVMDSSTIYRLSVSGSTATVVGHTTLEKLPKGHYSNAYEIVDGVVIGIAKYGRGSYLALWHYPSGGKPYEHIHERRLNGTVLSVAPTHK